jgi:Tfp pilus assembly protein PilX
MRKQQGFFVIAAVILIVIIGFLGIAITYMFVGSATSNINFLQSSKAFYIADGGLEKATRYLSTPVLSGAPARIACDNVTANSNLTNSSLGDGTFTVTSTGSLYVSSPTTVSGALTATATTIPVSSTTNYQNSGRIMVDREFMNYAAKNATNFLGVTRGVDGTTATTHASGTRIGQYQCILTSSGGVPNLTSPQGKRVTQQNVQLQEAWIVGNVRSGNYTLLRWNNPTEITWNNASATGSFNLNAVSMDSYVDGWAVGASRTFLRWTGNSWGGVATGMATSTWTGVYCISANLCVAVGNASGGNPGLAHWNGSAWAQDTPSGSTSGANMAAVNCGSSTDCWAVGASSGGKNFYNWNGSAWTGVSVSGLATADFPVNGVFCNSSTDCWAVGSNANFPRKNGATWVDFATGLPNAATYNSIFCNASNDCWVVGNVNGGNDLIAHWNGTAWSRDTSNPTPTVNLEAVTCAGPNDCWAAGSTASGGILHYNGTNWAVFTASGLPATTTLNGIDIISPNRQPESAWTENIA